MIYDYQPADKDILINGGNPITGKPDPSIMPIRLSLPNPPDVKLIDGYGLKPEDQYFRRAEIPEKLVALKRKVERDLYRESKTSKNDTVNGYKILNEIWEQLESHLEDYKDEIKWIRTQWYHRFFGYWFFNKGKPTYITGWNWMYLNYWKLEGSVIPQYRNRNRKTFLFWDYIYKTHETFKHLDKDGNGILNEYGEYEMIDQYYKTFLGVINPKGRREGISSMCQLAQFEDTSRKIGGVAAIFSKEAKSALKLFRDKTVAPWKALPFFFLPVWDGIWDQSNEIEFNRPRNIVLGDELNSRIGYAHSAFGPEYDSQKGTFYIFDESGKCKECSVEQRWMTHKQSLAQGDGTNPHGFSLHPSTIEDLEGEGGMYYQSMIFESNFYNRNHLSGQTKTGLAFIFIPDYEGLECFVDKYGDEIMLKPTEQQKKEGFPLDYGSYQLQISKRDEYLRSKKPKDMIAYMEYIVKHPHELNDCFQLTKGSTSFNLQIINTRCAELRRIKEPFVLGNFEWTDGFGSAVKWVEDKLNGRWEVSKVQPHIPNQRIKTISVDLSTGGYKEIWTPKYPQKITIGADPTSNKGNKEMLKETNSSQSDGGIVVLQERDKLIDKDDNCIEDWETYTVIAVYRNRVLSGTYNEDLLKGAIYYGGLVFPETNTGTITDYFTSKNYDGYLLYDLDPSTGKQRLRPGVWQAVNSKELMWDLFKNFIQFRGMKQMHASLLIEISSLKTFEDLHKNDMAAAFGCALLGSNSRSRELLETIEEGRDEELVNAWYNGEISW